MGFTNLVKIFFPVTDFVFREEYWLDGKHGLLPSEIQIALLLITLVFLPACP